MGRNVPNGRRRKKYLIMWTSQRKSLIPRTDIRDIVEYQLLHSHLNKRSEGRADHLHYLGCCQIRCTKIESIDQEIWAHQETLPEVEP